MPPIRPRPPTGSPDQISVAVITGSDTVKAAVLDLSVATAGMGVNDGMAMLRLLGPGLRLQRDHIAPNYLRQRHRIDYSRFDLLWNVISDIDQNPQVLAVAQKLTHGARPPLINAPKAVSRTRRDDVANNLANIENVRTPKVLLVKFPTLERITALVETRGFQFPAIVRQAGKHNGEILGIFESPAELSAIFGDRRHEYYLTEYVDIRRSDGLYRKTRFFFIGDQIVMRHHLVADQWSIHGGDWAYMAEHESLMAESRSLMDGGFEALAPQTQAALQAIRVRIGLEFCGLDCCLMEDGSVVVFECNATMNFNPDLFDAPGTQHNRSCLPRALSAMRRLIEAKTGKTLQRPTPA